MRSRLVVHLLPLAALLLPACAASGGRIAEAEAYYAAGDYYQAYVAMERLREDYPDDEDVDRAYWNARLAFLLKEGQRKCFENHEGGPGGALEDFEKALVIDEDNAIAKEWIRKCKDKLALRAVARGDQLRATGNLKEALIAYHEALTHQPGNEAAEEGLKLLGERWRKMQDEAQERYLEGVRALADELFRQTRYHLLIALDKDPTLEEAVDPAERARRVLTQQRFADAQRMEAEGYYAPALREYKEIKAAYPDFEGIDELISRAQSESEARTLAEQGEMAIYRGDYAGARDALQRAFAMTTEQKEAIGEKLLLVHEREIENRYFAAKDRELQRRYDEAVEAYREIDRELPGYSDVRARISDLEIRIEEATNAYEAGVAAENAGDVDAAIQHFTDVLLYWPGYRDSEERLATLRGSGSGSGT